MPVTAVLWESLSEVSNIALNPPFILEKYYCRFTTLSIKTAARPH